jgi:hypothetical protein
MKIQTFSTLRVFALRLDALAGITSETVVMAGKFSAALSATAQLALALLQARSTALNEAIRRPARHANTALIKEGDKLRDELHAEVKRLIKAGLKSALPTKVEAAKTLDLFLSPFWDIDKLKLPDQTHEVFNLQARYSADEGAALRNAAATLGIAEVFAVLFEKNAEIAALYDERLSEQAEQSPAASYLKDDVVKSYEMFCTAVLQDLNLNPSEGLTALFNNMERLRVIYAASRSRKANASATAEGVAP